ncbi:DUF488 family protein [Stenotrophomonas maltophilia]|uniref:DUF488 domain-containing protein n=1 Tax=Stenotrophomonas TaxID=40323 RepID=UPI000D4324E7|nr:DUF488 family protein [Stenotrophomonas maltophilia]MBA0225015.1 DUF488 family protein [Stenotrophomonas maltophilia]MBA0366439.1 DUF488 family protein [Stenotrophomonas maltophilia]MBA0404172.1 DUF488 family protein [Stenotrophomonas maltophilia]MCF3521771.1 DUF488 family protein [Stenotrophomonas maltophilia]PSD16529.1 DUF488 domain-containing protein [Stenotrophomonas maltophilia]
MALRVVRLGTPRQPGEGLRIGTVRRPPRGVPRSEFAPQDWYDVWFPTLSPSAELVKRAHEATTAADWTAFFRHYKAEMKAPDAAHALDLLAAMSQHSDISVGCYCEDEAHCHRKALRELLVARGAMLAE